MRRRTLLATAGTVLFAGCEQVPVVGPDTTDAEPPATTSRTASSSPTGPPTTTATESPTETLREPESTTRTDTGTATDTETETPTPSRAERRATARIETARSHLSDALSTYLGFADVENPTLLDVDASVRVTVSNVTQPVSRARTALDEVPQGANPTQQETVDQLRGVGTFLEEGIRCQAQLYDAYDEFQFVVERIYNENLAGVPDDIGRLRQERENADSHLRTLEAESDSTDMTAFEGISRQTYSDKVEQFDTAVSAFGSLADAMTAFRDGMEEFDQATDAYVVQDYRDAREQFPAAEQQFGVATDTLSSMTQPASVADTVSELVTVTRVLASGSRDMARAARAGFEGRSGDREDAFAAAAEHFRSSQVVMNRIESVEQLLD